MSTKNTLIDCQTRKKKEKTKTQQQGVLNKPYIMQIFSILYANISAGTIFQPFGPTYDMVSNPFNTVFEDG